MNAKDINILISMLYANANFKIHYMPEKKFRCHATLITFSIKYQHSASSTLSTIGTCKQAKIFLLVLEKVIKNLGILFVCFTQSQVVGPLVTI